MLDLEGLKFIKFKNNDEEMQKCIIVETDFVPTYCVKCRRLYSEFYRHGTRWQMFHDAPIHGYSVMLKINRIRYKCRECGGTFEEPLPMMHPDFAITQRLHKLVVQECFHDKFTDVGRRNGLVEKTVRSIFRGHVDNLIRTYCFETPEAIGIDEVHIQKLRCVITSLKERSIIDMLPERNDQTLIPYLLAMDRNRVRLVAIDMYLPYRKACQIAFPKAEIVVDRFHVERLAMNLMVKVRRDAADELTGKDKKGLKGDRYLFQKRNFNLTEHEQECLLKWVKVVPILGEVYEKKERFLDIWDVEDRKDAEAAYDAWDQSLQGEVRKVFKSIRRDFKIWGREIFNWWDHKTITNAYTESVNGRIQEIYSAGNGYCFDVLRAKIICKEHLHKRKAIPEKFNKDAFDSFQRTTAFSPSFINYGVDISKLLDSKDSDFL